MEETWELAVVSHADVGNSDSIDFEFVEKNLLVLDTHLRLLLQATTDFESAKKVLTSFKFNFDKPEHREKVWDNLAKLSDSCWRIGQIMKPDIKNLRKEESDQLKKRYKNFVKERGCQIRALLNLNLSEKETINSIRNSSVHVDERLDEWYVRTINEGARPKKISFRSLANDCKPDITNGTACLFWYDYHNGEIHHLGSEQPFSISALARGVETVNAGLKRADDFLQSKFKIHGRETLFRTQFGELK